MAVAKLLRSAGCKFPRPQPSLCRSRSISSTIAGPTPKAIPRGTDILVRVNEAIDFRRADEGRIYDAAVDQDILDDGGIAMPKGTRAGLLVREVEPGKT